MLRKIRCSQLVRLTLHVLWNLLKSSTLSSVPRLDCLNTLLQVSREPIVLFINLSFFEALDSISLLLSLLFEFGDSIFFLFIEDHFLLFLHLFLFFKLLQELSVADEDTVRITCIIDWVSTRNRNGHEWFAYAFSLWFLAAVSWQGSNR